VSARRFDGQVALVTGGNSGMGLAVARGLVAEGAKVVISGRNAESLRAATDVLGAAAHGVVADVAKLADIDRLVAATAAFGGGRLDVLFASACLALFRPIAETTEAHWDSVMDVKVKGVYFTVQ